MRRVLFFMAATIAASAAAVAMASPSTATTEPTAKWFVPSASAVAGPNHTFTLTVSLMNVDMKYSHMGTVTVALLGTGFGQGYQAPPIGNITLNRYARPGHTWTYTLHGYGLVGKSVGIKVTAVHVGQASEPPGVMLPDVTASRMMIVR